MVNFRIVENAPPSYVEKYDEFVELYNDHSVTVKEIGELLGWSTNVFEQAKEHALSEGKISLRKPYGNRGKWVKVRKVPKYYSYSKNSGKFTVKKHIFDEVVGESVLIYYGSYKRECVAKRVVEELKKVDWDKNKLDEIHSQIMLDYGFDEL